MRNIRVAAVALIAALSVTACGGDASDGESGGVTLQVTWWGNNARHEATTKAIEAFERMYPEINVEVSPASFSGYYDKINTQFAAGAGPDVFQDDQVATYASQGRLLALDDQAGLDLSKIDPGFLDQAKVDGKLYELPAGSSPMALVVRDAALDAAGVEIAPEMSWDEFADAAKTIQRSLPEGQFALADSSSQHNHFQVFLRQRGKDWFSADGISLGFSRDDLVDWWAYWADLRAAQVTPPADVTVAAAGGDVTESPVAKNLVAMSIYGTSIQLPSDDWRYEAMPNEAGHPGVHLMRANAWAINANTEHPAEAVKLINFLVNDIEAGEILGMSRGVPPNAEIAEAIAPGLTDKEADIVEYVKYLSEEGNSGPSPAPDPDGTRNIRSEMFDRHAQTVLFDRATPDEAADAFIAEATSLL